MNCRRFRIPVIIGVGVILCCVGGYLCWTQREVGQIIFGIGVCIFTIGMIWIFVEKLPKTDPRDVHYYSFLEYSST